MDMNNSKTRGQTKSKERIRDHGEVFTAEREVKAMCDLVKDETERIDSRFLEPACGDGNFLAEILTRKLAVVRKKYGKSHLDYEKNAVLAASSIYGVDILQDNVIACRERMFGIWDKAYTAVCKKIAAMKRAQRCDLSFPAISCAEMRSPFYAWTKTATTRKNLSSFPNGRL